MQSSTALGAERDGAADAECSRISAIACRIPEIDVLDDVVRELQEIERHTGIEKTLAIGELVLRRFFGGDPKLWRDRRRNKNNSIRRLADCEDCPFRKSALNDAVAIYVVSEHLPCVRSFGHIGAAHVATVLGLRTEEQERILLMAKEHRWSVRELKQRVVALRRSEGEKRGRPSVSRAGRAMTLLRTSIQALREVTTAATDRAPQDESERDCASLFAAELIKLAELLYSWAATSAPSCWRGNVIRMNESRRHGERAESDVSG
ncbi:MAG: hypothetical protein QM784_37260 [Polyangiaceae bacterium]